MWCLIVQDNIGNKYVYGPFYNWDAAYRWASKVSGYSFDIEEMIAVE